MFAVVCKSTGAHGLDRPEVRPSPFKVGNWALKLGPVNKWAGLGLSGGMLEDRLEYILH